ncbi:MAG: transcriptional regulator [Cellulomonas sp.]|jgi:DNA-binding SARP family transcriptional activator|uniref:AfsR/SARP family transcriptional regulator n=1 Tax=Cellulomonas sp. TaxID=40001 RepID=UPI001A0EEDB3|nr:BTAD domain-containing putative transcriptional regulator [Cellulomonas sp.]MBF0686383.1 transcriptional regulator [Cellulomonas sp.]
MSTTTPQGAPLTELRLLEGFELRVGGELACIPPHSQRVLAFLAVQERSRLRQNVAFSLWADSTEERARASLRTALWKLNRYGVLVARGPYLELHRGVDVDLHRLLAQALRLVNGDGSVAEPDLLPGTLVGDLLPDWDEDWLLFERERLRQLRMHALESLAVRLSAAGRHAEAIDAAQAAVAAEPLRESAQATLIRAHLAEGNPSEARRQYGLYRVLLADSLGRSPGEQLQQVMRAAAREMPRGRGPAAATTGGPTRR